MLVLNYLSAHIFEFVLMIVFPSLLLIFINAKREFFEVQSSEEGRKAAYEALHGISTKLRSSTDASSNELYHKLISMVRAFFIYVHLSELIFQLRLSLIWNFYDLSIT